MKESTMSPTRRILLNTCASYGRTLVALFCGLFSIRWVLAALGKEDFGLYTLVGSLLVFVSFFNTLLGISVSRYYAYAIGECEKDESQLRDNSLKRWFNAALSIHTVVPLVLLAIGLPVATYAIRHWINIPQDRIEVCVWVFRIALVTTFLNMVQVPFVSMFTARQLIAELSVLGFGTAVLTLVCAYFLQFVPWNRLLVYSAYMMVLNAGMPLVLIVWAVARFPECRLDFRMWGDRARLKELFSFAGWTAFGFFGYTFGHQGIVVVTNHYFGVAMNSAYGISNQLASQTGSLAKSLLGALGPVVTSSEGAGNRDKMIALALRSGKLSAFLLSLFAVPLVLEMDEVLRLWLVTPPDFVVPVCVLVLLGTALDKLAIGCEMALNASGRIALWQCSHALLISLMVVLAIVFASLGWGPTSAAWAYVVAMFLCASNTVYHARRVLHVDLGLWFRTIVLPLVITVAIAAAVGCLPLRLLPQSFLRICVTSLVSITAMVIGGWKIVLDREERSFVMTKFCSRLQRIGYRHG